MYVLPRIEPDPADIPQWCSFCNDFAPYLVLCSTCRVGVCMNTSETTTRCLNWDPCVEDPTFIFKCHLCSAAARTACQVGVLDRPPIPLH